MTWTDDKIERLRELWGSGMGAADIAAEIGVKSKNAVIGKANRLRLGLLVPGRMVGRPQPRMARTPRPSRAKAPDKPWHVPAAARPPQKTGAKTLIDLEPGDCRYPLGERPFQFCAQPKVEGVSYCLDHARLCFRVAETPPRHPAGFEMRGLGWHSHVVSTPDSQKLQTAAGEALSEAEEV